ncbi:LuxR C-terminal-related transcriptional regulator [Streptosporangium sp. OZ121]|uniref:response regulator transcription factor n=1 Tax=Streptosporangium sp. OZ121 TaxID=3444183 RepID=UPI003F79F653
MLVLSQYVRVSYTLELLDDGAHGVGYLLKDRVSDLAGFAASVRQVGGGGSAFDPIVVDQLVGRHGRADDPLRALTGREREVLALMAEGRTNQAVAERIGVAERTVIFVLAWSAAVWTVSLCTYITRGAFSDGANHLALIIPSVVAAGLPAVSARHRNDIRQALQEPKRYPQL